MPDNQSQTGEHTPGAGHPSPGAGKGSQQKPKESYTAAEHEKEINSIKREHGREVKTLNEKLNTATKDAESSNTRLKNLTTKFNTLQSQMDEFTAKQAGDSEQGINWLQKNKELREREEELEGRIDAHNAKEAQFEEDIKFAQATKFELGLWEVAQKAGISVEDLKRSNPTSIEQAEDIAELIAEHKVPAQTSEEETPPPTEVPVETFRPDSAITTGGEGKLEAGEIEKMPISQVAKLLEKQQQK